MKNRNNVSLILLGDGSVGKTSIIRMYSKKEYSDDYETTIGLDYASTNYTTKEDKKKLPVTIWDTAGQERFRTITQSFYKKAHGIIICYDSTNAKTFNSVETWMESIYQNASNNIPRVLVATKIDMARDKEVTTD